MIFVWEGYIGYCKGIILKHYEGTWRRKALCLKNNAPRDVIPPINLMQLFMLHRMVPSMWLKHQCFEGYFNGKVKNNALSIKNGRATPKR